jgi:UDP-N-acetylglucosamine acyltransferase
MSQIHSTAIIETGAVLADTVKIGPYCVVGADVKLGANVELKSHVAIDGDTDVGEDTVIYPFASIGHAPQDLKFRGEKSRLIIGKNNTIREHATMNPGTQDGAMETVTGDNCLFMMATHVAHDCIVGNNVIMANNATLGGHVEVGNNVLIGGLSAVHQFVRIGDYAVVGGMSGVENDIIPYGRVKGERAFLSGLNLVGLERNGFSKAQVKELLRAYGQMFNGTGTLVDRIDHVKKTYQDNSEISKIVDFANAERHFALCQPQKK